MYRFIIYICIDLIMDVIYLVSTFSNIKVLTRLYYSLK